MSNYVLNDDVEDTFTFEVGGHQYSMAYPTLEEIEELRKLADGKEENNSTSDESAMDWMYKFVTPVIQGSPSISEVMKKQNIRVIANFAKMVKTEFGLAE